MQCEFCGGEVNLSIGRCTKCGRWVDASSDVRLTYDLGELAELYGIKSEEEKQEEIEALPELLKPNPNRREEKEEPPRDTGIVYSQGPTLGREDYELLLEGEEDNPGQTGGQEDDVPVRRQAVKAPFSERVTEGFKNGIKKLLKAISRKLDEKGLRETSGYMLIKKAWSMSGEKLITLYNEKFPALKRVRQSTLKQKIIAAVLIAVFIIGIAALMISLAASIAPGVRGEWLITETGMGEKLTWEFTGTGKVIVRTYGSDGAHIYRTGTYKKKRRNDHNMLTITYEDGTVTRLYYEISRGVGTFTNVDSNRTAQYKRIRR